MSQIDPDHKRQIEDWLGRQLTNDELRPVESLDALSDDQLAVVAVIRPRNLIAPLLYLRFVVPSALTRELINLIDNIAGVVASRRPPLDLPNLPLFERYLGRSLEPVERMQVAALEDLSPAHIAAATALFNAEPMVGFLYLQRIAPAAPIEACSRLATQLTKK